MRNNTQKIQRRQQITKNTKQKKQQKTNLKKYYKAQLEQLENSKQKQTVMRKRTAENLHTATQI